MKFDQLKSSFSFKKKEALFLFWDSHDMKKSLWYTWSTVTAGITMVGIIVTGSMSLNLIENFGSLEYHEQVKVMPAGDTLKGEYANALSGMSLFIFVICALYLTMLIYIMVKHYKDSSNQHESPLIKVYWVLIILSLLVGISSAGLDFHLIDKFNELIRDGDLKTDPMKPITGENYKLSGSFGKATLGMAITSVVCSSISIGALIWFEVWHREASCNTSTSLDIIEESRETTPMMEWRSVQDAVQDEG